MADSFVEAERRHYDSGAIHAQATDPAVAYSAFLNGHEYGALRASYAAWLDEVREPSGESLKILDYCAGRGFHSLSLQKLHPRSQVFAIDISSESLKVGKTAAEMLLHGARPEFREMDAHRLEFEDATFDLISNFGSFSSLDFARAKSEILRVLKPGGKFVALETFGHNPVMNLKRRVNVLRGTRTSWAANHIVDSRMLSELSSDFSDVRVQHFGLFSPLAALSPLKSDRLLSYLERVDQLLFRASALASTMSFKVLFAGTKRTQTS